MEQLTKEKRITKGKRPNVICGESWQVTQYPWWYPKWTTIDKKSNRASTKGMKPNVACQEKRHAGQHYPWWYFRSEVNHNRQGLIEHPQRVRNKLCHAKSGDLLGNMIPMVTLELNHNRQEADGGTIDSKKTSTKGKKPKWHAKNWSVTLGNKIAMVTHELNHNRQQDADGGTIDRK